MIKVHTLMSNVEPAYSNKETLLRAIGEKYKKRLSEKPNFWFREVESIKMDFTLIPYHDDRLAFWLIRKGDILVVQCFVFKYQYSISWQLILSEEVKLKSYDEKIYNVERAEKDISKVFERFLEMECKDNRKDDDIEIAKGFIEVDFYNELLDLKDVKPNQLVKVKKSRGYTFAGYYLYNGENWEFEGDLD